jgi:hypothetical protein
VSGDDFARFLFMKLRIDARLQPCRSKSQLRRKVPPGRPEEAPWRRLAAKNLEVDLFVLEPLQPIEIPQNGQRILWKSLDKNSLVLEKLAKKLGGAATRFDARA